MFFHNIACIWMLVSFGCPCSVFKDSFCLTEGRQQELKIPCIVKAHLDTSPSRHHKCDHGSWQWLGGLLQRPLTSGGSWDPAAPQHTSGEGRSCGALEKVSPYNIVCITGYTPCYNFNKNRTVLLQSFIIKPGFLFFILFVFSSLWFLFLEITLLFVLYNFFFFLHTSWT